MIYVSCVTDNGEEVVCELYGPFASHAKANHFMQTKFDDAIDDNEEAVSDDSDASHFYTEDEISRIDWFIVEPTPLGRGI